MYQNFLWEQDVRRLEASSIDLYNNDVGKKFMK